MALEQLYLETGMNKVEFAIDIMRTWQPTTGYSLEFSGGKDSVALKGLAIEGNIKFDAHYRVSPIDPPQVHQFIKEHHPDVEWNFHAKGFWKTVIKKQLPMRNQRWCCELIKEAGGINRTILVGNRHSESPNRKNQCFIDTSRNKKQNKIIVRPLLHWDDYDVWLYIKSRNLPYCSLYDEGFTRLGCVLCPNSAEVELAEQYFPKIVKLWKRACDQIIEHYHAKNRYLNLNTGEELYQWWVSRK